METRKSLFNFSAFALVAVFLVASCGTPPQPQSGILPQQAIAAGDPGYWTGDGGRGASIAIFNMSSPGLNPDEQHIPLKIRGALVEAFNRYSAMDVMDMVILEQLIRDGESDFYAEDNEIIQMGEVVPSRYQLRGNIQRTTAGLLVQINVVEAANARQRATFNDNFPINQIDDLSGIRRAANEILSQMGISLTAAGQEALMRPASANQIQAHNALARGITAQRQGTEVAAHSYFFMAASFDPTLREAVNRYSILNANIRSGNIGDDVRSEIEWRNAWVQRLTETEQFFADFHGRESMPYTLFYTVEITQGAIDWQRETVNLSIETHLHGSGIWTLAMERALQAVYDGLRATGRAQAWGLHNWPRRGVTNLNAFARRNNNFSVVFELLNDQNRVIGRQTLQSGGFWELSGAARPSINVNASDRRTLNFQNVSAHDITDRMSIRVVSVNGIDAETAARGGVLQVHAVNRDFFEFNDRFRFARGELQGFRNAAARDASMVVYTRVRTRTNSRLPRQLVNLTLPSTIWGDPVISIDEGAFANIRLPYNRPQLNITIPCGVVVIRANAFRGNSGHIHIVIPESVTYIGDWAFAARSAAWGDYPVAIQSITIGANVNVAANAFQRIGTGGTSIQDARLIRSLTQPSFQIFYNENGSLAGVYTPRWPGSPSPGNRWRFSPQ